MTIDSAHADSVVAAPTDTRPLPVITPAHDTPLPDAPRWQVYAAVAAGLLGGVLMVAGVVLPW